MTSFNILLLGLTGAGKSTLINSIANYFTYETFEDAMEANNPICVIPTIFRFDGSETLSVFNFGVNDRFFFNEEVTDFYSSATQEPLVYSFYKNNMCFNLIDVPGLGKGILHDSRKKKLILNMLQKFKKIHGIFFVINAEKEINSDSLLDILFMFHSDITFNLMFITTKSRVCEFDHERAILPFYKYLKEIEEKRGIVININLDNVFCIDSEGYRHQCAAYEDEKYRMNTEPNLFKTSWEQSKIEILHMFNHVSNLQGRDPNLLNGIRKARKLICNQMLELISMSQLFLPTSEQFFTLHGSKPTKIIEYLKTFFKFKNYVRIDSIKEAEQKIEKLSFDLCLPCLPSFSCVKETNQDDDIKNYYQIHKSLEKIPKQNKRIEKIIAVETTKEDVLDFLSLFETLLQMDKYFIQNTIIKLFIYFQYNGILNLKANVKEWIILEIKNCEWYSSTPENKINTIVTKLEKEISKIKNAEPVITNVTDRKIDDIEASLTYKSIIIKKNLNRLAVLLPELDKKIKNANFMEEFELLQMYSLKYKVSVYFKTKCQHQIMFVNNNASLVVSLIQAIVSLYDYLIFDDYFAFPHVQLDVLQNSSRPQKYYLDTNNVAIAITDIPYISAAEQNPNECLVIKNILSNIDINAVCIFFPEDVQSCGKEINLEEYLNGIKKFETLYFIFHNEKNLNAEKNIYLNIASDAVKKYNVANNANIPFSNENVYMFNTTAFDLIAEYVESDDTILKIEKNFYDCFLYSIQELQHFMNSMLQKLKNIYTIPRKISFENSKIDAVGIDFGTSRCCIAVNRRSGMETVALENTGGRLLPSYVAYDEINPKCGQIAVDRLRRFSKSTVFDIKRLIGRDLNSVNVERIWPFKLSNVNNTIIVKLQTSDKELKKTVEEVAADLMKHIKKGAETFQGKKLTKAVVAIPASYTKSQKNATIKASKLAGWEVIYLLPEPVAATFAYFIDRPIPDNSILLLFDLGGGTLDVCVFKNEKNKIKIISNCGDLKLGGRDFDDLLIDYFLSKMDLNYDSLGNMKYKLLLECQKIKHNLSIQFEDQLFVEEIDQNKDGAIEITQDTFKNISSELLLKIRNTISSALYVSKFEARQIDKVIHVGGGCRMPMIKELLQNIFLHAEHCQEIHPDEVVAIGAAYHAYNLFSRKV